MNPAAEHQVASIRKHLLMLERNISSQSSLTKENYQKLIGASGETQGCSLFGIGCENPLIFPDYRIAFHLKKYSSVQVFAKH